MKHRIAAMLTAAACLTCAVAWGEGTTYVFPYEGFRYVQQDGETVLTQTNLREHEDLLESLGTNAETVLASYVAAGIVMEVIPDDGGQIAVSVTSAGDFDDVDDANAMTEAQRDAFLEQFASSGLYETCDWVDTEPPCVRMTSSATYASMPVYTLRYATLHLGRLYLLTQTIAGREPEEADDARMEQLLSNVKLLSSISEVSPTPTAQPAATPEPTALPTPGVAEVLEQTGTLSVEGVPAFTSSAQIAVSGLTKASETVTISIGEEQLAKGTAKKDGTFSMNVTLPQEGHLRLTVESGEDSVTLAITYEMAPVSLEITEPVEPTFTGENVTVRGVTEPGATVYISGEGNNTNVKADKNGAFSIRVFMSRAGTQTFELRAKADGFEETTRSITLTRELTEREWIAEFRAKMIALEYDALARDVSRYAGSQFIMRGKVMAFTDYDGSPCAVVCVTNPSTGVWHDPVYVVLSTDDEVALDDILTFYLVGEGITLPADGAYTASGEEEEAPVARAAYVSNVR